MFFLEKENNVAAQTEGRLHKPDLIPIAGKGVLQGGTHTVMLLPPGAHSS